MASTNWSGAGPSSIKFRSATTTSRRSLSYCVRPCPSYVIAWRSFFESTEDWHGSLVHAKRAVDASSKSFVSISLRKLNEFDNEGVGRVDVTFLCGQAPTESYLAASSLLAGEKCEFGASRAKRWFDRDWAKVP